MGSGASCQSWCCQFEPPLGHNIEDEYFIYFISSCLYDMNRFTHEYFDFERGQKEYIVKMKRVQKTLETLKYLWSLPWLPIRKVASYAGQIISMNIVLGPVSQIMTMSINIARANSWNYCLRVSVESKDHLAFWET